MSKLAFIFPGQGAQKAGMGKDFYENSETARSFFDQAQKILDFDLKEMCFGEHEELNLTEYTQPCMVSVCLAIVQELKKRGINPDITAGLSLGEYAAVAAAGGMNELDAIKLVRRRGILMQNTVPTGEGAMAAVLGLDAKKIEEILESFENVWIAKSAKIAPTAYINGPAIIGKDAEVRHCAFIRGNVIVGEGAVVGNSTELKNAVLFNKVQVPHYNYVGDAVLGYKSHMGAGSICSNVKSDKKLVVVKDGDEKIETGLKKFGAMLGDHVEVGCGSVLNPGTVIGRNTNIYPLSPVRGCIPADSIYKNAAEIIKKN